MPRVWVCLSHRLRHVMGSSRSQQGTLGDTLPVVQGDQHFWRDSPFSTTALGAAVHDPNRRLCSFLRGFPNGGTHNSLVSV